MIHVRAQIHYQLLILQKSSVLLHSLHQIHTHFGISHQVTSIRVYEYETHTQPLSVAL